VYDTPDYYLCENSQAEKRKCKVKIGKVILQQPISAEQAKKLLSGGRTDVMTQFISKAGRPFAAFLVMDDNGKVGFEFPPREEAAA
jgi:DNA topoisomerase-3